MSDSLNAQELVEPHRQKNSLDRIHAMDPGMYRLSQDETTFFKSMTGIDDDEELKNHILAVQSDAYETITRA
jgi:hypothetical protein